MQGRRTCCTGSVRSPPAGRMILTHGEDRGRQPLGKLIKDRYRLPVEYPGLGE